MAEATDELVGYWESQLRPACTRHGFVAGDALQIRTSLETFDPVCRHCHGDITLRLTDRRPSVLLVGCLLRKGIPDDWHDCDGGGDGCG